jgi:hypothetical protein
MVWDKPKRIIDAESLYSVLQERITQNQEEWDMFIGPNAYIGEAEMSSSSDNIYSEESD